MYLLILIVLCALGVGLLGLVALGKFPLNAYPVLMMPSLFLLFVVNGWQLHESEVAYHYITESIFTFAIFVCLLSFLSVILGWCYVDILPKSQLLKKKPSPTHYPYDRLFKIGTVCHILSFLAELVIAKGRGGLVALYSKAHSFYSGDDNPILFYLFFLTFVGTVPYLQCLFCDNKLSLKKKVIILLVCASQIVRTIIVGQRGWVFNLVFIYVTVPFFCIGKPPRLQQVLSFLLPAALFVIILPAIRGNIYLGSGDFHKLPELVIEALQDVKGGNAGSGIYDVDAPYRVSSEFILGAATIAAAWEHNDYTYGLSFYDFLINPIPRAIWPEKPKNLGLQTQVAIINNHYPWRFNDGSAPTGIADVFLNFGFFCVPFWFFFGLIHRLIYNSALKPGNYYSQGVYVSLLWGTTFLMNQSVLLWGTTLMSSIFFMTLFYSYARVVKPRKNDSIHECN